MVWRRLASLLADLVVLFLLFDFGFVPIYLLGGITIMVAAIFGQYLDQPAVFRALDPLTSRPFGLACVAIYVLLCWRVWHRSLGERLFLTRRRPNA